MVEIELENRSGVVVDADQVAALCRSVLDAEGVRSGDLGVALVAPDEIRSLKQEHLGVDEVTDVLSFPIDRLEDLPPGVPRQLGDIAMCPQVVGESWRRPLVHGLLHLLGYTHGEAMEAREDALLG